MRKPKLLVIVGPTASGKTGLSIELAKQFNGEVISADSRQVYKGMDIGTAKVTETEMAGVPHHLLDVVSPNEIYAVSDWVNAATKAIEDIVGRGKLPIVAGGTFFYIDSLLGRINIPDVPPDHALRTALEEKSESDLFEMLENLDPDRAVSIEKDNKRRLIRAIEIATYLGKVPPPQSSQCPYEVLTIGLSVDMETHGEVIKKRLLERFDAGMVAEVEKLLSEGVSHERLESFGLEYRYISRYLRGLIEFEEMINELAVKSRQYAKRQMTWLKRDPTIHWFKKGDPKVVELAKEFLTS